MNNAYASTTTSADSAAGPTRKTKHHTRSRTGCLTCRTRRVKCDERPGTCANCERMGLTCDRTSASRTTAPIPTSYYKTARKPACLNCRTGKTKCDREKPACTRCRQTDAECHYPDESSPAGDSTSDLSNSALTNSGASVAPAATHPAHAWSPAELDPYLNTFFNQLYQTHLNSFVHRSNLERAIAENRAPELLVQTLCAISARSLHDPRHEIPPDEARQIDAWTDAIKVRLIAASDTVSLANLACCYLLHWHEMVNGRWNSSGLFLSMACRMAYFLGLNEEPPASMGWAEQETRRRLMWGCFVADSVQSDGIRELNCCPPGTVRCQLPCAEQYFFLQKPVATSRFDTESLTLIAGRQDLPPQLAHETSLEDHWIRLMAIRIAIIRYTKTVEDQSLRPWHPDSEFNVLQRRYAEWEELLQPELRFNLNNLYARHATNTISFFIALHITCQTVRSNLYRIAVPGLKYAMSPDLLKSAPIEWVTQSQRACFNHSKLACEHLAKVAQLFPKTSLDPGLVIPIHEAIKNQLAYKTLLQRQGAWNDALLDGFEKTVNSITEVIGKSWFTYPVVRPLLKDLHTLIRRHGYDLDLLWQIKLSDQPSGVRTPANMTKETWSYGKKLLNSSMQDALLPVDENPQNGFDLLADAATSAVPLTGSGPEGRAMEGDTSQALDGTFDILDSTWSDTFQTGQLFNANPFFVNMEDWSFLLGGEQNPPLSQ